MIAISRFSRDNNINTLTRNEIITSMPDGVKALLDVILQTNDFSESNLVFDEKKLTIFSFRLFFRTCWKFHVKFHVELGKYKLFFPC